MLGTLASITLGGVLVGGLMHLTFKQDTQEKDDEINELKRELRVMTVDRDEWEETCKSYYYECEDLKRALRAEIRKNKSGGSDRGGVAFKSDDAKELVKFAMQQAHPDKPNGSHEKFIKYREIYEKVCK